MLIYKSYSLNEIRIDFNQPSLSETKSSGRRPMSLLFKDGRVQLIDHKNKTVSNDLYELLVGTSTQEQDHFDGRAFELANSTIVREDQNVHLISSIDL